MGKCGKKEWERKESVTLTRLEGKGVGSLEVGKGGIGNGEGKEGKAKGEKGEGD